MVTDLAYEPTRKKSISRKVRGRLTKKFNVSKVCDNIEVCEDSQPQRRPFKQTEIPLVE